MSVTPLPPSLLRGAFIVSAMFVLSASALLRFTQLEDRPLHFDEGTNARILSTELETGSAAFDPAHHHGPLLSLMTARIVRARGESGWEDLTKRSLRLGVAACGVFTILASLLLGRVDRMGRKVGLKGWAGDGLAAAAFIATSPMLVYYSRMFIHEPLFVACGMLTLLGLLHFHCTPSLVSAIFLGLGAGLMAAARETFVFSLLAWGLATLPWLLHWHRENKHAAVLRHLFTALSLLVIITAFIYSDYFRRPTGLLDFLTTYIVYDPVAGHDKPFGFYFSMLLLPKYQAGVWWTEILVFLFASFGYLRCPVGSRSAARFLMHSGLLHLLMYSLLAYKTPWLASLGWLHICLAAGLGANHLVMATRGSKRILALGMIGAALIWQGVQAHRACFRFASDARNPYAYVPTSTDIERMAIWLENLVEKHPELNAEPAAVVGNFYWPLPWYLREFDQVGYWNELPDNAAKRPLLFILPTTKSSGPDDLEASHVLFPRGLRHEVPVTVAIRKDIWERENAASSP